ncbi:MAG TPA: hypothetical protein VL331_08650 [Croceibacterium sp.]|jgi:hypothetical protein|nr:hypothetical protein [Croceibacterium sp.]
MALRRRNLIMLVGALAIVSLTGCATGRLPAPLPTPAPDSATLIIIRPAAFTGGGVAWPLAIDGQVVAELGNDEHVAISVAPGEHILGPGDKRRWAVDDLTSTVIAKPGERYYFVMTLSAGFLNATRAVTRLDPVQGRELMAKTKQLE